MTQLRRQLDQAVRQKTIGNCWKARRTCMEEEEYLLALQKIQEILQLDPPTALPSRSNPVSRRAAAKPSG